VKLRTEPAGTQAASRLENNGFRASGPSTKISPAAPSDSISSAVMSAE
jgi:hypothetical protein